MFVPMDRLCPKDVSEGMAEEEQVLSYRVDTDSAFTNKRLQE